MERKVGRKGLNERIEFFHVNSPKEITWNELKQINKELYDKLVSIAEEMRIVGRMTEEEFTKLFI